MNDTRTFDDVSRSAEVGCWRLETEHSGPQLTWAAGPALTSRIMELAGRAPFEAQDPSGDGRRLYLAATLENGSFATCDFVGTNNPGALPTVDIRLYSRPFIGENDNHHRIESIMRSEGFRIGVDNEFAGGRKVQQVFKDGLRAIPDWRDLDWDDLERICPITPKGIAEFLRMLSGELDKAPKRNFEATAAKFSLTV